MVYFQYLIDLFFSMPSTDIHVVFFCPVFTDHFIARQLWEGSRYNPHPFSLTSSSVTCSLGHSPFSPWTKLQVEITTLRWPTAVMMIGASMIATVVIVTLNTQNQMNVGNPASKSTKGQGEYDLHFEFMLCMK